MGLYDDDNNAITTGDVLDVIYWQGKFANDKLSAALKSRQPEGNMRLLAVEVINSADDVLKRFPNHKDVQAWKENAAKIQSKVDSNAPMMDFKSDFDHWKDHSYEAGWRSYHIAKMASDARDVSTAKMHTREAITQFTRSKDRMAKWPADIQQFVNSALPEMQSLDEKLKA